MPKRAALLFDQLMVALQKVVDNQGKGSVGSNNLVGSKGSTRNKISIGSTGISKPPAHHFQAVNSEIIPMVDDQTVANLILTVIRKNSSSSHIVRQPYISSLFIFLL